MIFVLYRRFFVRFILELEHLFRSVIFHLFHFRWTNSRFSLTMLIRHRVCAESNTIHRIVEFPIWQSIGKLQNHGREIDFWLENNARIFSFMNTESRALSSSMTASRFTNNVMKNKRMNRART